MPNIASSLTSLRQPFPEISEWFTEINVPSLESNRKKPELGGQLPDVRRWIWEARQLAAEVREHLPEFLCRKLVSAIGL